MPLPNPSRWHFNIDTYLNPLLLGLPIHRLPYPIAHFLGHREKPRTALGNIPIIFWAFVGAFSGILLIEAVSHQVPLFRDHGSPIIVGSFGAAAVLEFYAIESPLSQPRNSIFGQLVAAIVGTAVCKLFALSPYFDTVDHIRWVGGALACACATAVMALTGTVHPPAGATALLAVVDDNIVELGWYLIPVVLLGASLMLCVALLINNIQRQFPVYWWTPEEIGHFWKRSSGGPQPPDQDAKVEVRHEDDPESGSTAAEESRISITRGLVVLPDTLYLRPEERTLLETLSQRL